MSNLETDISASAGKSVRFRFLRMFLPCVLVSIAVSLIFFRLEYRSEVNVIRIRELAAVEIRRNVIREIFQSIASDLMYLAETARGEMALFPDFPRLEPGKLASNFLIFSRYKRIYDQIRILDATGMERVRVNYNGGNPVIVSPEGLQDKGERYYFQDTMRLRPGQVYVSPFDLNIENGRVEEPLKPMIRFGTPLTNGMGEKTGAVLLNYLGADLIEKIDAIPRHGEGETMLLNAEGYWLIAPDAADEWGFMFPDRKGRVFGTRFPEAWGRLSPSASGQFMTKNGLFTFGTLYPLREGMVSSTGAAEAHAPSKGRIAAGEYQWKLVSRMPGQVFSGLARKIAAEFIAVNFLLVGLLGLGCWKLAFSQWRRDSTEAEKVRIIQELQAALSKVKTLTGLIPICSYCKKIRDDQGYWNQVEKYFRDHSQADFTHSICPACEEKVMNEMDEAFEEYGEPAGFPANHNEK